MKVESPDGISVPIRREANARSLSLCHVRTQQGSHLQARKQALTRSPICWHLDLGLSSLHNCEKRMPVVCKPPGLWFFVIAAWADGDILSDAQQQKKQIW